MIGPFDYVPHPDEPPPLRVEVPVMGLVYRLEVLHPVTHDRVAEALRSLAERVATGR